MAGMDWFRWHHGSVTDPKFALVARKAGASLPDVLAVWTYLLETASQAIDRGDFGVVDCEALDCVFDFPPTETRTEDILKAMAGRELIDGTRITAWEKRQVRREREDLTSTERKATSRAKKNNIKPIHTIGNHVTPSHTIDNQKTPRVEESREEENKTEPTALSPSISKSQESETETELAFVQFWFIFPKKVAKPAAFKAFKAQKAVGKIALILSDVAKRSKTEAWLKNGGEYIPNPATYLNGRRWEDEGVVGTESVMTRRVI